MSVKDRYIPGVPCWADTSQPDPEAAVEFYRGLFGWELEDVMPPDQPGRYFTARLEGGDVAAIGSVDEGAPQEATWNTYVWVESADATAARAQDAGGRVVVAPFDVGDAGRMAVLADREGAVVMVWEPRRHRGAQVVNEPGSVNFNDLNSRDPEAAQAFYGAVFGWRTLDLGGGAMWTLPGYGAFLDSLFPGTLQRMADLGAPEGFEDVVASLHVLPDDQPDTPAHWGVTFAVEDADAVAARAAALGGTVLMGPFDAPWVRMAVLADPQGATFTASQFVPENRDVAPAAGAASA